MIGLMSIYKNKEKNIDTENYVTEESGGYYDDLSGVFIMPWVSSDKSYFIKLDTIICENKKKINKKYRDVKMKVQRGK